MRRSCPGTVGGAVVVLLVIAACAPLPRRAADRAPRAPANATGQARATPDPAQAQPPPGATTPTPASGTILFERSYTNNAWGYRLAGFYIDSRGDIYAFNHDGDPWPGRHERAWSEETLIGKFRSATRVRTVDDPTQLADMVRRIPAAARGKAVTTGSPMNDAGQTTSLAYLFDPTTRLYTAVMLSTSGDVNAVNTTEEAKAIDAWLKGLKVERLK